MKFDLVISNPPYNSDLYLDFVRRGFGMLDDGGLEVVITPAKWQGKYGDENVAFREVIVPHIENVVYFKEAHDVFNIAEPDGISIYSIDKSNKHSVKYVKNCCAACKDFDTEYEEHYEAELKLLPNKILGMLDKIKDSKIELYHSPVLSYSEYGGSTQLPWYVKVVNGDKSSYETGYANCSKLSLDEINKYKAYIHCRIVQGSHTAFNKEGTAVGRKRVYICGPGEVPQGNYIMLRLFDSKEEAEAFDSYCKTKFARFMYFIGIVSSRDTLASWRFVPEPGRFDHTFSDEELYARYGFTDDEVNVIERVISQ